MNTIATFLNKCWWNYFQEEHNRKIIYISSIPGSKLGWYLWLKETKGVYELIVNDSSNEFKDNLFIIRYYPSPKENFFENFSCAEQIVRLSNYFENSEFHKETNTTSCACSELYYSTCNHSRTKGYPKFHSRKMINPNLYEIGKINFVFKNSEIEQLILSTQDYLKLYSVCGFSVEKDGTTVQLLKPGEEDRNVPAWEICNILQDALIKDVFKQMGIFIINEKKETKPGTLYYQEKEGDIKTEKSSTVSHITQYNFF